MSQTQSPVALGNRRAKPTELRYPAPRIGVMGLVAIEDAPHVFRGAVTLEKRSRLIAELLLLVGELEVHNPMFALSRGHSYGAIESDNLAVQHGIVEDVHHQGSVLFRISESSRENHLVH